MRLPTTLCSRPLLIALAMLLVAQGLAQSNFNGFTYQAVVRNNLGDPVPSQVVGLRAVVQVGPNSYAEDHSTSTDAFGLVSVVIGQGTPVAGSSIPSFGAIDWAGGQPITYTVSVDVNGGTNYVFLSGGPFKAVPFAYHALTSDSTSNQVPQTLSLSNDTLYISGGNKVHLPYLSSETDPKVASTTNGRIPRWNGSILVDGQITDNGTNVGIGTTSPAARLDVAGNVKIADGTQGAGKVLKSDANGLASWGTFTGSDLMSSAVFPNLSCPAVVGTVSTGGYGKAVAVSGSYAYVAAGDFHVINISNPAAPTVSGTASVGIGPRSVAVSGNYAYVANEFSNNFQVINVTNPAAPSVVATLATGSNSARGLAVSGNYAYLVGSGSLRVINIANPTSPSVSGSVSFGLTALSVAVSGNYAYVPDLGSSNLKVINVSNPAAPTVVGTVATGAFPFAVTVSGTYAYVVNASGNTLQVINISNPAAPSVVGTVATNNGPSSVAVSGNYAYVANASSNTLQVIDISNPAAPAVSGSVSTGTNPSGSAVLGNYAYVSNESSTTLQVIDLRCSANYAMTVNPVTGQTTAVLPQWTSSGSNLYNANTGNVGVGTSVPTAKLDVAGSVKIADGTQGNGKVLTSDANGVASWQTLPAGADNWGTQVAVTNTTLAGNGTTGNPLRLPNTGTAGTYGSSTLIPVITTDAQGRVSTVSTATMTETDPQVSSTTSNSVPKWNGSTLVDGQITDNGTNVGIGTTAPTQKLDVNGGIQLNGHFIFNSNNGVIDYGPGGNLYFRRLSTQGNINSYTDQMTILDNGNVGIGTTTPDHKLSIATPGGGFGFSHTDGTTTIDSWVGTNVGYFGTRSNHNFTLMANNGTGTMTLTPSGNVGIGTNNPVAKLHVVPGSTTYNPINITYFGYNSGLTTINWTPGVMAAYFQGNVLATASLMCTNGTLTTSDMRIKRILSRSDAAEDLATLNKLQVTNYRFIDSLAQGSAVQKKVIAQEVEAVYPNAIKYRSDHIPDIYSLSCDVRCADGKLLVTLDKPHQLAEGDHLKWIAENGEEHFDTVTCVMDEYTFELPSKGTCERIFVWGRKVNDLRTVDYDALSMLNVSATQQLYKLVCDLQEENERLRSENASFRTDVAQLKAQQDANTALLLQLQSVLEAQTRK